MLASTGGVPYKLPNGENGAGAYGDFLPGMTGLGDILEDAGYHNYFMCGSSGQFAGRTLYYQSHGGYQVMDIFTARNSGFVPEDYEVFWGMEDEKVYEYAKQELTEIAASGEPFNFNLLTADTHMPDGYVCRLCNNTYEKQYANVIACASRQAVSFIDWVKEQS